MIGRVGFCVAVGCVTGVPSRRPSTSRLLDRCPAVLQLGVKPWKYVNHSRPDPQRHVRSRKRGFACQRHSVAEKYLVAADVNEQRWEPRQVPEHRGCQRASGALRGVRVAFFISPAGHVFTDPFLRALMPDWEYTSLYHAASFRAQAGTRLGDPPFCDLVERLLQTSDAFAAAWESRDIQALTSSACLPPRRRRPAHGTTQPDTGRSSSSAPCDLHPRADHRHPHTITSAARQPSPGLGIDDPSGSGDRE
jgi:MmyB-like transcription regulator ligand binding domain